MTTNLWGERLTGTAFILLALYMGGKAWSFPAGGSMFPLFVSAVMILVAGIMLGRTFLRPGSFEAGLKLNFTPAALKPIGLTLLVVLYVLAVFRIGYYATTFILLVGLPFALGLRRPGFILGTAFGATAFIYVLFEIGLSAGMPSGVLF